MSTADDPGKRAELVSTISHELRGPISTIKGLAATSRSFYDQLPDDEKREFLELIEQEADRMLEIVSEASLAMKLSARVLPLQRGPADLAEIVREGVEAAGLDHDRRVDLELADVSVEGDRTRLIEVVRQVVRNAAQYSPPDRPVEITLTREGDTAVASYAWDEMRFSISWKAYCFADAAERRAWRDHTDDLALDTILDRLVDDLRARGRLTGDRPAPTDLALLIIDEYIKFP